MIKKRLVGVVTVRNGWAVQSIGYSRYLPLGRPEVLVENLDRWGADEIFLQCIDRTRQGLGPDFALIERIGKLGISTPLIYGGGVVSADHARQVVNLAADRVSLDALLRDDPEEVRAIAGQLGAQAVIAALPVAVEGGEVRWLDYRTGQADAIPSSLVDDMRSGAISEALLIDWRNEGRPAGFDADLLRAALPASVPVIAFGGLSEADQLADVLREPNVVAAAVGNFLSYRETAIQQFKKAMFDVPLRPASFQRTCYA